MPPQRTIPALKTANMKTERTHEENQERAYIAASRRSDRSLEARVESARRASEIHKRRTGRALRVTEQDVLNEEMYEEEEDDLPLPYRQLTQHLTTGSVEFNRRLAAYLTNHVAVRSALDQIIRDSHGMSANGVENFVGNFGQQYTPSSYAPPMQSSIYFADTFSPTSPTFQQQPQQSQAPMETIQAPVSGTQFHMGPLGLSTVQQGQHRTAPYARKSMTQTNEQRQSQQQIPHQQRSMSFSEAHTSKPSQFKQQRQNQGALSTPPTPTSTSMDSASIRRLSMPVALTNTISSPIMAPPSKLAPSMHYQTPSPSPVLNTPSAPSPRDHKMPSASSPTSGTIQIKQEYQQSNLSTTYENEENNQKTPLHQADLGPLDLSIQQNAHDLLLGGFGMPDHLVIRNSTNQQGMMNMHKNEMNKAGFQTNTSYDADGEYLNSLMMDTECHSSLPNMGRFDSSDYNNNASVDEMWQDFFASDTFNNEDASQSSVNAV